MKNHGTKRDLSNNPTVEPEKPRSPVDYRLLLWKYIMHVGLINESTFDPRDQRHSSQIHFTAAELDAFGKLANSYAPRH